jgi:hypothetical protein
MTPLISQLVKTARLHTPNTTVEPPNDLQWFSDILSQDEDAQNTPKASSFRTTQRASRRSSQSKSEGWDALITSDAGYLASVQSSELDHCQPCVPYFTCDTSVDILNWNSDFETDFEAFTTPLPSTTISETLADIADLDTPKQQQRPQHHHHHKSAVASSPHDEDDDRHFAERPKIDFTGIYDCNDDDDDDLQPAKSDDPSLALVNDVLAFGTSSNAVVANDGLDSASVPPAVSTPVTHMNFFEDFLTPQHPPSHSASAEAHSLAGNKGALNEETKAPSRGVGRAGSRRRRKTPTASATTSPKESENSDPNFIMTVSTCIDCSVFLISDLDIAESTQQHCCLAVQTEV